MQSKQKAIYTFGIIHTAFNDIKGIPIKSLASMAECNRAFKLNY